ncbi:efflux RND transporter periplasmic adaptor subunit [Psychrobium sp. MM17-31]|uniref:efflux RND transporter periplasmic adaptor subunit n=1 Tax=Psychrobium sp. MM17-31 TaxID=2917758 RepID=UPI001EF555CE|nr:efflux RND transporter periplasmic adaptor subunit [Psychrobium sp. MM17-31]MCG7531065.1 efflux RND transporter periplasmic adaptor subunit [Psychrobium sp. MM17-31]
MFSNRFSFGRSALLGALGIGLIIAALFYNSVAIANRPVVEPEKAIVSLQRVSVMEVSPALFPIVLQGNAQAQPKYQLALTSQVNGQVQRLAENFESGKLFRKDDVLAWIEPTQYQQSLAGALQAVEQAKVSILEEERQRKIVERDRGVKKQHGSALVYRTPQLKAAKAGLETAQRQVAIAKRDLDNTHIKVPFDALVVQRAVAPGQYVQQGQQVATLYDANTMEFRVFLPNNQWRLLTRQWRNGAIIPATIKSLQGDIWHGRVDRIEQHIDLANQQRAVIVRVDQPLKQQPQLFAGTFTHVELTLDIDEPLLAIPAKSVSADGQLWFVKDNYLNAMDVEIVYQKDGVVYIKPPLSLAHPQQSDVLNIVATPLPTFVVKQSVLAVAAQS